MKAILKSVVVSILTLEARLLLARKHPKIIAVTGSVGKTTTKDAIYAAIKNSVRARKSEKSFNSELGIPLTVLGLQNAWNNPFLWLKNILDGLVTALFPGDYPEYLIIEAGVDRPGDMRRLTEWLKPDITVLTRLPNVPVHVEYFKRPEEVVREKMFLVSALKSDGVLFYNHDDAIIQSELKHVRHTSIGFSRYQPSHFTARDDRQIYHDDELIGTEFTVGHLEEEVMARIIGSVGDQHLYSMTAAIAVASVLGIDMKDAAAGLESLTTPPGRMRIIRGVKHTLIIDDTYNSSPIAVESALSALREIKNARRRIAVLGDMLELGQFSVQEHERMGELVAKSADILFTLGVRSRKTAEGALEHGMSEKVIFQYDSVVRAGKELQQILEPGDVILIKGSQGVRAERIVEEIMADPDTAPEVLCRQDPVWKRKVTNT